MEQTSKQKLCDHNYKKVARHSIVVIKKTFWIIPYFKREYVKAYHLICFKCGDYKYIKLQNNEIKENDGRIKDD